MSKVNHNSTNSSIRLFIKHNQGVIISSTAVLILLVIYMLKSGRLLTPFQAKVMVNGGMALAFASVGVSIVVITGGFDASVGSIIGLVNVLAATTLLGTFPHDIFILLGLLLVGVCAGLLNGLLVAVGRIQSIIVTLAMMFVWTGVSLLILNKPGGFIPTWFAKFFEGTIFDKFPIAVLWLILLFIVLSIFRHTHLFTTIYAIGSDEQSALRSGINVVGTKVIAFSLAGLCYAISGLFLSAQTTSGDPNIGDPFLLTAFTAVVVGGTQFGGGRGSLIGSIFGAYIVTLLDSVLLSMGVTSYYTDIVQGSLLVLAVAVGTVIPLVLKNIKHKTDA